MTRGPRLLPARHPSGGRDESGQATVELALGLPVLLVGLLLMVQGALVLASAVGTVHAAREAARAVAVDGSPGVAEAAVRGTGRQGCTASTARPGEVGATLTVEVACLIETDVPVVGPLIPSVTLRSSASMRVER